jgi:hypothetical protein
MSWSLFKSITRPQERYAGSEGEAKESEVDMRMCPASIARKRPTHRRIEGVMQKKIRSDA